MTNEFGASAKLTGVGEFVDGLDKIKKAFADVEKAADGINLDKLESQVSKAGNAADDSGKKAEKGGSSWKSYAAGAAVVTAGAAALGGGLSLAVGNALAFEKQIDAVGAVSGASEQQLAAMGATALRIGEDTAFGAQEMGAAMEELAAQGISADDIINGVADATAALAAAGGTDLVTAATAASTAMGVWGLETSDMTEVVNRLTGAASVSAFGIEDMLQGMASGGIAAKTFGISMEDTTTALAALSQGGFQSGSDAGTSFKAMLTGMAAPAGAGAKAIAELGLNFRDANGEMKPVPGLIEELHSKLDGLDAEDRDKAMARIFGTDGMRAAGVMMGMTADEFTNMSNKMESTDAAAIAAKRIDNLSGDLDNLGGVIETASIKFGKKLIPALRQVTQFAAAAIPVAFAAIGQGFNSMMDALAPFGDTVSQVFSQVSAAVMPVVSMLIENGMAMQIALGALAGVFTLLGVAAGAAAVSMLIALAPIIAITAAAALLGAGVVLLVKNWDQIVEKFPIAGKALDGVKDRFEAFTNWLKSVFMPGVTGIADAMQEAGERAAGFVNDHWNEIQTVISGVLTYVVTQVDNVFNLIGTIIESALMIVSGIIKTFTGLLSGDWEKAWEGIKEIARGVWMAISGIIEYQIATIQNIIKNLGPAVLAILSMAWDLVKNVTQAAWDGIKAAISAAVGAISGVLSAAGGAIKSAASAIWDAVKSAASDAWNAIKSAVGEAIKAVPALISAGAEMFKDAATTAWNGIKDGAKAVWDAVSGWVAGLPGEAADLIRGGASRLLAAGETIFNQLWEGMKNIFETVKGWVTGLPGEAADLIKAGASLLLAAGQNILNKLWEGIRQVWDNNVYFWTNLPQTILSAVGDLGSVLKGAGEQVIQGFIEGVEGKFGEVKSKLGELTDMLPDWKGPASKDKTILFDSGSLIIEGLIEGIRSQEPNVRAVLLGLTDDIYATTAGPAYSAGTGVGAAVGSGIHAGIGGWGSSLPDWINTYTIPIHDATKTTSQAAGSAVGGSIGVGVIQGLATIEPDVLTAARAMAAKSSDAAITEAISSLEEGTTAFTAAWANIQDQMEDISSTAGSEAGAAYANKWEASLQAGLKAGLVSAESYAKIMMGVIASVNDPFSVANAEDIPWDWEPPKPHTNISDDFLWRGAIGNSPETNIGALLGLAPGNNTSWGPNGEVINGESGFMLGGRGGQHSANKVIGSGEADSVVANGWKWNGKNIVKMDNQEAATRFISGWNSILDPNTLLSLLGEAVAKAANDGISAQEISKIMSGPDVKALALVADSGIKGAAENYLKFMHAMGQGKYTQALGLIDKAFRGSVAASVRAQVQALIDGTTVVPTPVTDSGNGPGNGPGAGGGEHGPGAGEGGGLTAPPPLGKEMPDILADGMINVFDVVQTSMAGFTDVSESLKDLILGVADMADVMTMRSAKLDDIAAMMLKQIAGMQVPEISVPVAGTSGSLSATSNMFNFQNANFGNGNPAETSAMIERAVDRAISRQARALPGLGVR
jgi:TP901 family phage tail tape measure protein